MSSSLHVRRILIAVTIAAIGCSTACTSVLTSLRPAVESDASTNAASDPAAGAASVSLQPTVAPTRTLPQGQIQVPVKRDSITESLSLDGLVSPAEQVPINYPGRGTVVDVKVKAGQAVKQGDVLLELDSTQTARDFDAAQARLQDDQQKLIDGQQQLQARQQAAAARAQTDQQTQQQAIADATTGLRDAMANLSKVQAGASVGDRQAAADAVNTAQAALTKAQNDQSQLQGGPNPDAVRQATRDVSTANLAVSRAQANLDALTVGPDPTAVRAAQSDVEHAQSQLQLAQAAKPDPKQDPNVARIQHDAAVQDAQAALNAANARMDKLKQPPSPVDVQAAKQALTDAQDASAAAQAKLSALSSGPDQATLDSAQSAVDRAQQALNTAQAQSAAVASHPTPAELADAQDQVRKAQVALDNARKGAPTPTPDTSGINLDALQQAIDQDRTDVDQLGQALQAANLTAPFDGTIVSVRTAPGDSITSLKQLFVLAKAGAPIVRVDLDDDQVGRLSVGQAATVLTQTGSASAAPIAAKVATLTPASADGTTGASATFEVEWGDDQTPRFGLPVTVDVPLQEKDGVLVVPVSALRVAGDHTAVEVLNGTLRHLVTVQVGIKTDSLAEIVSGLSEGQMVLANATS